ncbi:MAG: hypothetical protein LQ352_008291, partial [Teloschistes flavicans]
MHRASLVEDDRYVFAKTHHRLAFGETRQVIARFVGAWEPTDRDGTLGCEIFGMWVPAEEWQLTPSPTTRQISFEMAPNEIRMTVPPGTDAECQAQHVTIISVTLPLDTFDEGQEDTRATIEPSEQEAFFRRFSWVIGRLPVEHLYSRGWVKMTLTNTTVCLSCAPSLPEIRWRHVKGKTGDNTKPTIRVCPYEDGLQAATFEKLWKARSPATIIEWAVAENNGHLRIHVNFAALAHQAVSKLSSTPGGDGQVSYCIQRLIKHLPGMRLPGLAIKNCREHLPTTHHFSGGRSLRPEQARVLTWMLQREDPCCPASFTEEGLAEAILDHVELQVMVNYSTTRVHLGGILAQEVGFGKTAVILALIDSIRQTTTRLPVPEPTEGKISTRATLVLVPPTIVGQWAREAASFLGNTYTVVSIQDATQFKRLTVKSIQDADIVIVNIRLLLSATYLEGISALAGTPSQSNNNSRPFKAWFDKAASRMQGNVERMKRHGLNNMSDDLIKSFVKANADPALFHKQASVRYRGQAYVEKAMKKAQIEELDAEAISSLWNEAVDKEAQEQAKKCLKRLCLEGCKTISDMRSPILHAFRFERIVIDEYTYIDDAAHTLIASIQADKRWALSGTAKTDDHTDLKELAHFLGVDLGEDEDTPGIVKHSNISKLRRQQTDAEQFRSLYVLKSMNYHNQRHLKNQELLDCFLRRDLPEIDEIRVVEQVLAVQLSAAELGISLELDKAVEKNSQTAATGVSRLYDHKMTRIKEGLALSSDEVEAKLKSLQQCWSGLTLQWVRQTRIEGSRALLLKMTYLFQRIEFIHRKFVGYVPEFASASPWMQWAAELRAGLGAQHEVTDQLLSMIVSVSQEPLDINDEEGFFMAEDKKNVNDMEDLKSTNMRLVKRLDEIKVYRLPPIDDWTDIDKLHTLMNKQVKMCRAISKEWVERLRSVRFFEQVDRCQSWFLAENPNDAAPICSNCKKPCDDQQKTRILAVCSHIICSKCSELNKTIKKYCPVHGCDAKGLPSNYFFANRFEPPPYTGGQTPKYSAKVERLIDLIKNQIPEDEQVLLFVQFDAVMDEISKALQGEGITNFCLSESNKSSAKDMASFQTEVVNTRRVLMLDATKDTSAGA